MTAPSASARSLSLAAEAGLAAVTMAVVLGMARLFDGGGWLGPLVVNALVAHLVAALCRRRGLSLAVSAAIAGLGAFLAASWTIYWWTTTAGLPTGETWSAMGSDLSEAWTVYQDAVAPAPAISGFVLASALALWAVAFVADWAAFRLWVPFEATLPAGTLFLFTALLGTDRGQGWAVALYAAALVGFLLLHRLTRQDGASHWVADRQGHGHRALLGAGAALGLVAVVAGTALGPSLPGADDPGVIDPRALRGEDRSRVTISPLVDMKARLVDQSSVEVFRVESSEPSYWRLTSLEQFDGRIWKSSGSYEDVDDELPAPEEVTVATEAIQQTFTIRALSTIWLPSAFVPRSFVSETITPILYDEDSSTLIVDRQADSSDGITYQIASESPRISEADLAGAAPEVPDRIADDNLDLPDDFSPSVRRLAQDVTAGADTPYAKARALQDHLRTFTYDLTVPPGHGDDALETFLFETHRGYCEQFAGAFAAMARSVGLPARVAVGFTQGEEDPAHPGTYIVRGEHAHAWPEVYFAGAGWVSFEPTPGRGQPFAEAYTGVAPQQAATGQPGAAVTAPPTTGPELPTATTAPTGPRTPSDLLDTLGDGGSPDEPDEGGASFVGRILVPALYVLAAAAGLILLYAVGFPLLLLWRRHRRRRAATTPLARVALAWSEAVEQARAVGYSELRSHTIAERSVALAGHLADDEAGAAARRLSKQLERAVYGDEPPDDLAAELAEESAATIQAAVRDEATLAARLGLWLDPRPHLRSWRHDRAARQRHITTTVGADREADRDLVGSSPQP